MTEQTFLSARIAETVRRAQVIAETAERRPDEERRLISAAVEELQSALEELRVADEELRQQNAELTVLAERAEREHRRYYMLFEFAPVGLLVTDASGTIREANRLAATLFSCERPFLLGKPLQALVQTESARALRAVMARAFAGTAEPLWALTSPGRGEVKRVMISVQCEVSEGQTRLRWALQAGGSDGAGPSDAASAGGPIAPGA